MSNRIIVQNGYSVKTNTFAWDVRLQHRPEHQPAEQRRTNIRLRRRCWRRSAEATPASLELRKISNKESDSVDGMNNLKGKCDKIHLPAEATGTRTASIRSVADAATDDNTLACKHVFCGEHELNSPN